MSVKNYEEGRNDGRIANHSLILPSGVLASPA